MFFGRVADLDKRADRPLDDVVDDGIRAERDPRALDGGLPEGVGQLPGRSEHDGRAPGDIAGALPQRIRDIAGALTEVADATDDRASPFAEPAKAEVKRYERRDDRSALDGEGNQLPFAVDPGDDGPRAVHIGNGRAQGGCAVDPAFDLKLPSGDVVGERGRRRGAFGLGQHARADFRSGAVGIGRDDECRAVFSGDRDRGVGVNRADQALERVRAAGEGQPDDGGQRAQRGERDQATDSLCGDLHAVLRLTPA